MQIDYIDLAKRKVGLESLMMMHVFLSDEEDSRLIRVVFKSCITSG